VLFRSVTPPARAADLHTGSSVGIGRGQTVDDDVYAAAATVDIQGTVRGDVVAVANTVTVSGTVNGDLIVIAGTTIISGSVGGNVRAATGTLTIEGLVGRDVLAGSGGLQLGSNARVGRDVILGSGTAALSGQIGRHLRARARELAISGLVAGNVRAEVQRLQLARSGEIGGDLSYTSSHEASIAPGALIRGAVHRVSPEAGGAVGALGLFGAAGLALADWLRTFIGLAVLGLGINVLFPGFTRRAIGALSASPLVSFGVGLAAALGLPAVALVLFLIGLFTGGWWLSVILLAAYATALSLAVPLSGLFAGRWLLGLAGRPEVHPAWALLLGLAAVLAVGQLPFVGPLLLALAAVFGLGAEVIAIADRQVGPSTVPATPAAEAPRRLNPEEAGQAA
jgi:cytoskeletal protein CcmA (bactofilin family)